LVNSYSLLNLQNKVFRPFAPQTAISGRLGNRSGWWIWTNYASW